MKSLIFSQAHKTNFVNNLNYLGWIKRTWIVMPFIRFRNKRCYVSEKNYPKFRNFSLKLILNLSRISFILTDFKLRAMSSYHHKVQCLFPMPPKFVTILTPCINLRSLARETLWLVLEAAKSSVISKLLGIYQILLARERELLQRENNQMKRIKIKIKLNKKTLISSLMKKSSWKETYWRQ